MPSLLFVCCISEATNCAIIILGEEIKMVEVYVKTRLEIYSRECFGAHLQLIICSQIKALLNNYGGFFS